MNKKIKEDALTKATNKVSAEKDAELEEAKSEIDFTYTITNNGDTIKKDFKGTASPQDVVMTLLSCLISDVKTNLQESAYEEFLDIIGIEYAKQLLPHLLEKKESSEKK